MMCIDCVHDCKLCKLSQPGSFGLVAITNSLVVFYFSTSFLFDSLFACSLELFISVIVSVHSFRQSEVLIIYFYIVIIWIQ